MLVSLCVVCEYCHVPGCLLASPRVTTCVSVNEGCLIASRSLQPPASWLWRFDLTLSEDTVLSVILGTTQVPVSKPTG